MSAKAFLNWEAYANLEPWMFHQDLRDDYRSASIRKSLDELTGLVFGIAKGFGIVRGKYQSRTINDLRVKFDEEQEPKKPQQTLEQQWKILNVLAAMYSNES